MRELFLLQSLLIRKCLYSLSSSTNSLLYVFWASISTWTGSWLAVGRVLLLSYPDGDPRYSQLDQTEMPDPTESHSQTHHLPMTWPAFKC